MGTLKTIARHLLSRRGVMLVLASILALTSIFLDGQLSAVIGAVAVLAYSVLVLQLSVLLSQHRSRLETLRRDLERLSAPSKTEPEAIPDPRPARRIAHAIGILDAAAVAGTEPDGVPTSAAVLARPLVSVVVPCHNEQRFVAETLSSVHAQSFQDWECIVVDDASTDGSLAEIWAVTSEDERFRVLRHVVNGGLSASRNTGLRAARGRFITFLDSDDLLMTDSLLDRVTTLVNALDDPHVIGSYSDVKVDLEDLSLDDYPRRLGRQSHGKVDLISADAECPFPAHAPVLVTDIVRRLGGFDERMRNGAEDWDLWYRTMRNGYIFVPSTYRTIVYRQKRGSMVRSMADLHVEESTRLINAAHRDVEPSIMVSPSPTPLSRSLGHYHALIRRADRAVRFAVMTLLAGRVDAARRILEVFAEAPLPLFERHLDIPDLINRGIQRSLSINPEDLQQIAAATIPLREQLYGLIHEVGATRPEESFDSLLTPTLEALLVPQHAGQLRQMVAAARDHGIDDAGLLLLERETGGQGVSAEIPPGMRTWTLNDWVLNRWTVSKLFVGGVRLGIIDQIARSVTESGGEVLVVEQDGDQMMRLDEADENDSVPNPRPDSSRGLSRSFSPPLRTAASNGFEPTEAWQIEEYPGTLFDPVEIGHFRDLHRGQRAVIIGNGPSLNQLDLSKLAGQNTIAVNGIFYAAHRMEFDPTYYVVEDTAFMRDNLEEVKAYRAGHKFFPSIYRPLIGTDRNVTYFMMNRGFYERKSPDFCIPRFSTDPTQRIYSGQSVTIINLQLAFYLGFEEVVLIGMDFSYSVPEDAVVNGDIVTSAGDDPNHFHPDYFGAGKMWKDPKLERVLANYALAKRVYEANGRRIVNATAGGKLELFDRVDFEGIFS